MNITRITPQKPACYGICCPRHSQCRRYDEVEHQAADHTIATCSTGPGEWPLFVALETTPTHQGGQHGH